MRPAPLLLAYDGECALCCRMVDWVQRRDRWGLLVTFPLQNPELLHMAPELAGRPLHVAIHSLDTRTRKVLAGAEALPSILLRLPRWRLLAPLMGLPGMAPLARRCYLWIAARRHRVAGRASLHR